MNGLALCAGVGGIELGMQLALAERYRTVCYVEREAYAAATLVARMEDKALDTAPIWDDLRTFDGRAWRGAVDIITAGFPCQPWSAGGKRKGTADERWLWPHIARIVGEAKPCLVFLENSPRLDLRQVLPELAKLGFDAEWGCFSAAQSGAPHLRQRTYLLAHSNGAELREQSGRRRRTGGEDPAEPRRTVWWSSEPEVSRLDDGTTYRVDASRCSGNGVVPAVAAAAFRFLEQR